MKSLAAILVLMCLGTGALAQQPAQPVSPVKMECHDMSGNVLAPNETLVNGMACHVVDAKPAVQPAPPIPPASAVPVAPASDSTQPSTGNGIVEKQNVPLAMTIFMPEKNPEVGTRIRLATFKMKVAPVVAQTMNHEKKEIGLDVKLTEAIGGQQFTYAAIAFTADGEAVGTPAFHTWTPNRTLGNYAAQTVIENASDVVHRIAKAREAYLTVVLPGVQAPFNQISFKLSSDQLENFRRMAEKYDFLEPR
jgi:hypothetical protein